MSFWKITTTKKGSTGGVTWPNYVRHSAERAGGRKERERYRVKEKIKL